MRFTFFILALMGVRISRQRAYNQNTQMNVLHRKTLTKILLVFVASLLYSQVYSATSPCNVDGNNRLGLEEAVHYLRLYSGVVVEDPTEVLTCGTPAFEITNSGMLSTEAKRYFLCRINAIRSQVALGTVADNSENGSYPVAANMQRMRWDHDLATVAQNHAAKCSYGHNANREDDYATLTDIINPAVGENISTIGTSRTIDSASAVAAIETAFAGWNGENDLWYYDTINTNSWAAGVGHFTQNIWAETLMIGCGQAWCPGTFPNSSLNMVFTVCNYYTAGNWLGEYPYETGVEVCSVDTFPTDTCQNGLITPADYVTGLDYECDVDGDNKLGLEEVIAALQTIINSN